MFDKAVGLVFTVVVLVAVDFAPVNWFKVPVALIAPNPIITANNPPVTPPTKPERNAFFFFVFLTSLGVVSCVFSSFNTVFSCVFSTSSWNSFVMNIPSFFTLAIPSLLSFDTHILI